MTKIKQTVADSVVITGGEPTSYNLSPLTKLLKNNGLHTFIETSGAYNLTGDWDWICLSPKKQTPPMSDIYGIANELKVIIACEEDLNWAVENAEKVNKSCLLYLQPEWSKCQELIPLVVDFVKNNQNWQLSLQTHKFIHIP
jgi:organic radical activating enzyme